MAANNPSKHLGLQLEVHIDVTQLDASESVQFAEQFSAECDRFELSEPYSQYDFDRPEDRVDRLEVWVSPESLMKLETMLNYVLSSYPNGRKVDLLVAASSWGDLGRVFYRPSDSRRRD